MADFIVCVADAFGLQDPHAVGPDIGTPALLFAAALHPGRRRSLVVEAPPFEPAGTLKEWVEASSLEPYRSAGALQLVSGALDGIERYRLPDHVREDYLCSYEGDRFVESMRYVRAYPAELPVLRDLLPRISTPVQIIVGAHDEAAPPSNAWLPHQRLPDSKLDILDTGHFTWEDAASDYAAIVARWWAGAGR